MLATKRAGLGQKVTSLMQKIKRKRGYQHFWSVRPGLPGLLDAGLQELQCSAQGESVSTNLSESSAGSRMSGSWGADDPRTDLAKAFHLQIACSAALLPRQHLCC